MLAGQAGVSAAVRFASPAPQETESVVASLVCCPYALGEVLISQHRCCAAGSTNCSCTYYTGGGIIDRVHSDKLQATSQISARPSFLQGQVTGQCDRCFAKASFLAAGTLQKISHSIFL